MNKEVASPAGGAASNLPLIGDLESIYCRLPFGRRQPAFAPLVDIPATAFLCPYTRYYQLSIFIYLYFCLPV